MHLWEFLNQIDKDKELVVTVETPSARLNGGHLLLHTSIQVVDNELTSRSS